MQLKLILCATVGITLLGTTQCGKKPIGCEVNNCQNGATCEVLTNGDICICTHPYWGKYCEKAKDNTMDVTFVIAHSANPNGTEWQMILDFMQYFVTHVPIGENALEIAIVTYSGQSRVIRKLNDPNDLASINKDIIQLDDGPGPLDLADALALLRTEVYAEANGDRPNSRNPVTLLIDGIAPGGHQRIAEEAEACRLAGIEVFANVIGKRAQANLHQARVIAIDDMHLNKIDSYADLQNFAVFLVSFINSWIGI